MLGLLVFSPLAFAGVPVWAESLIQLAAFSICAVWLRKESAGATIRIRAGAVFLLLGSFLVLVILQLIPMPLSLLARLSAKTAALYGVAGDEVAAKWHAVSIYPEATLSGLLNLFTFVVVLLVVANHYWGRREILRLVRAIAFMGCLLVVLAVLQKAYWNGRIYWFYPIDPAYESRLHYIWGPYMNRNHFAAYLEMSIPLVLGYAMYSLSREDGERQTLRRIALLANDKKLTTFAMSVLAVIVMSGALFATLSRGGILGFFVSLLVFIALMRSRRAFHGRTGILLLVVLIAAIVGLSTAWERIEARFMELSGEDRVMRAEVWSNLGAMIGDSPVVGTGLGTFDRAFPSYQKKYSTVQFEHAENDYLEILTDTGLIGFLLFVSAVVAFAVKLYRMWKVRKNSFSVIMGAAGLSSCAAVAFHSLTDFSLRVPANAILLASVAGITIAILTHRNDNGSPAKIRCKRSEDRSESARGVIPGANP